MPNSPVDRLKRGLAEFIEAQIGRRLLYSFLYRATVVSYDTGTGRADVVPDDSRIKGTGARSIEVMAPLAGSTIELRSGDRVTIGFDGGEPSKPFILAAEQATGSGTLERVARENDLVNGGTVTGTVSGGVVTFTYIPPSGPPVVSTTLDLTNLITPGPVISSGTDRAKIED